MAVFQYSVRIAPCRHGAGRRTRCSAPPVPKSSAEVPGSTGSETRWDPLENPFSTTASDHLQGNDYRKRLRTPGRNGAVGIRTGVNE